MYTHQPVQSSAQVPCQAGGREGVGKERTVHSTALGHCLQNGTESLCMDEET